MQSVVTMKYRSGEFIYIPYWSTCYTMTIIADKLVALTIDDATDQFDIHSFYPPFELCG